MKVFVLEALSRAAEQAKKEDSREVSLEHMEKILPQFLLDFAWFGPFALNLFLCSNFYYISIPLNKCDETVLT